MVNPQDRSSLFLRQVVDPEPAGDERRVVEDVRGPAERVARMEDVPANPGLPGEGAELLPGGDGLHPFESLLADRDLIADLRRLVAQEGRRPGQVGAPFRESSEQ